MGLISEIISGVISPVTTLFSSIVNKKEDTKLEMFKVDGKVDLGLLNAYKSQLEARKAVLIEQQKTLGGRINQYLFIWPLGVWWTAIIVYCLVKPWVPWWPTVLALPDNILPWGTGIVGFLFLTSKIDGWVRRT